MNSFVGREQELKRLRSLKNPFITVLYGRRRVGKSALIRQAFGSRSLLLFEGLENQPVEKQIFSLLLQLKTQRPDEEIDLSIQNWQQALQVLTQSIRKNPCILVLDEFQWMANYEDELVSLLKLFYDQYLSQIPGVGIVLCGSIASFMLTKVIRSKALYGRIDLEIELRPFQLKETNQLLSHFGPIETLEAQMIFGGIPLYLNMIRDKASLYLGIQELAFEPHAFFLKEYEKIFVSHFGENAHFKKIIQLLSQYSMGLTREGLKKLLKLDGGYLTEVLFDLESAGFIKSFIPFNKTGDSKLLKYKLTDPYLNFYLRFILPNIEKIQSGNPALFLNSITGSPAFYSFLGHSFENICFEHSREIARILGFSAVDYRCGPFFNRKSKDEKGVEIDLLFDRSDNTIVLCEIKYQKSKIGSAIVQEVLKKEEFLRRYTKKTIQKVLISNQVLSTQARHAGAFFQRIDAQELLRN